ncbi:MAG: iron ABC transporter substrate-binding protein [Bacteroidales bacterium]|jgi:iron complex transport system substrate-binding protein|nr:iron ABC transporter substrate-binding protein [Bacteroidales bacterium]
MLKKEKYIIGFCLIVVTVMGCHSRFQPNTEGTVVEDMLGRKITIPSKVERIVGIRAGTLRLLLYMDTSDMIAGIEEAETRSPRPYLAPFPELLELPVIGPLMGGDAEMILHVRPDVIFTSYTTIGEADVLQKKTGIPVVALECPEMATSARDTLYSSLRLIGKVLHKEERADSLVGYMQAMIRELGERTADIPEKDRTGVYIGGISYSGAKGIASTQPYFPPFSFTHARNVASVLEKRLISHVKGTYIDKEQLLLWDPDIIFIDESGLDLSLDDIRTGKSLYGLGAVQNNRIYTLLPYNNYAINYEMVLINSWFAAKVMYPEEFPDIDIREKGNEISAVFFGKPVFDEWITGNSFRMIDKKKIR